MQRLLTQAECEVGLTDHLVFMCLPGDGFNEAKEVVGESCIHCFMIFVVHHVLFPFLLDGGVLGHDCFWLIH